MIDFYKTEIEKGLLKRYNGKDSDIGILESVTSFSDIIFMGEGILTVNFTGGVIIPFANVPEKNNIRN